MVAFVFPGQGAQSVGMAQDIYDAFPEAREAFQTASRVLGYSVQELCFEGPEEKLRDTRFAQPALVTVSTAILRVLEASAILPDACAGHSLGEYAALVAAGKLSFEEALLLVAKRGELMAEADPQHIGAMTAIMGLSGEDIDAIIRDAAQGRVLAAANYNCPGQIVLSGDKNAIADAEALANTRGATNVVRLEVSGPFHSPLMRSAADAFLQYLQSARFVEGHAKVVSNVTASWYTQDEMALLLQKQIYSSVRWEDSIRFLAASGASRFIEVGPGKVIRGLMRRIDKTLPCQGSGDRGSLEKLLSEKTGENPCS
ncbi:MAG: ACP S-malonyltransferase [Spirochaetota bacterium]|jgi:[acyl-carrier-protein] S-malonyltransferase|nr:ACP S-malonyltransferase [Spirochaetota bacterium]